MYVDPRGEAKAPANAWLPDGPKAPGHPGNHSDWPGDPKGGPNWVPNPNPGKGGASHGWQDKNGNVWCPTGHGGISHGGPHWDVQIPGGGSGGNKRPLQPKQKETKFNLPPAPEPKPWWVGLGIALIGWGILVGP